MYVINRFSRTGGSAITIVEQLFKIGVHLIEVHSGLDTSTDDGKLKIYQKLLEARKQNMDRLEHTIPGMKKFVSSGHHLGQVSFGYDHFGPRVNDESKLSIKQRIVINEDGQKLRLAWEWKASGNPDYIILEKLKGLGLILTKQKLSAIWRRPFYCGIQINKLSDSPVKGNWEAMISEELFWKVQSKISENHQGYIIDKEANERPLTGLVLCTCGRKLTGYEVKNKQLHYYKCQYCKDATINANTPKVKFQSRSGAHELFMTLLDSFHLSEDYIKPLELQIKKMLSCFSESSVKEASLYKKQLSELRKSKDILEERLAFGKITDELYDKFSTKVDSQIQEIMKNFKNEEIEISNLEKKVKTAIDFSQNVSNYWASANLSTKKRLQNVLFPQGLILDTKKRQYLTSKVNMLFALKTDFTGCPVGINEKHPIVFDEVSVLVAGARLELTTFGL